VTYSPPEQLITLLSEDAKRVTDSKQEINMQDSNNEYFKFSRPEVQALVDPNSQTILDIGCASGIFGSQIKEKLGAEVWGIEPVKDIGLKAKKVIDKVIIGRVEDHFYQLPDEYFDSIIFSDILEHLVDPYKVLDLVKDKLSKNGEIIASIPNVRHWSVLKELLEGKWEYQDAGILDRTHLRFFTKSSIIKMFQNAGYKINEIRATQFGENTISSKLLNAMSQSGLNVSSLAEEANHYQYLLKVSSLHSCKEKMDELPFVSIIMLTWNALEYTKKCIDSIVRFTHYPHEIIFVDNASTDGSVEYLRDLVNVHDNYKLIQNKENKGFAGGNNQGVEAASGEYVMLLNNDVLVSENWLSRMVDSLEKHNNIGIIGPVTNYISGRQSYVDQYDGDDYEAFAQFIENENKGKLTPRRRLAGFAMLMKKDVFEEVNGFDETFGVGNFEDDDMSLKVRSKGFALMVDESVFIHHYGSQTFKANQIDILENLNDRMPIFQNKWPDVDYQELLEIKNPLDEYHSNLMNNGINKLERSDFSSAEKQFLQILQENPISEEALYGLALCSQNCQNNVKAMEYVNDLLQINPDHVEGLNQFGIILVNDNNFEDAKNVFIAAINKSPGFIDAQRNLAELFILEGDYDTGVQAYLTIIKNHPEDIPSLLRMAELNQEADNTKEASEWAELVLQLEPEHPLANQFIS
jgi:GT2 family glycosyltransferase/2-polyprenyl-3-methyl-5-hydroxy-6-metoxy-1,4-benzoquinol methylase/Tfp pilus assembly protein PilF|tara:strand:- start:1381 stop:3456 length:2076 start_codon:yes stop_codon:yes gene_type:complete